MSKRIPIAKPINIVVYQLIPDWDPKRDPRWALANALAWCRINQVPAWRRMRLVVRWAITCGKSVKL